MIINTNLGSAAIVQTELATKETTNEEGELELSTPPVMKPQFKRIFVCYKRVKDRLLSGYRLFFGLDGCHLKSPYKGILLSAVRLDANMQFYLIAYAIVEAENNDSWKCFIQHLTEQIGEHAPASHAWCIMSDRQKEFGTSDLKNMFWATTETGNIAHFQHIMDQIKEFNKDVYKWLSDIDPKHWSMSCFDSNAKVEHSKNNHVESFNDWIEEVQFKPPIEFLEGIRIQNTNMMYLRKVTAEIWEEKLTPKVHLKAHKIMRKARYAQIRGIPCIHAVSCVIHARANIYDYVSDYFTTENWRKAYEGGIHQILDESMWIKDDTE
ncbi:uncharacterized protein LOC133791943 [Humulus lupulus]|uniref:uncharacterized protein LOC133791943 n=1 Tax=Humulus lupulus TaxID=3486 RepID=UPI002B410098|nr:uncharacterized protein LOC133791943 [Humulus lupulus]